MKPKNTPQAGSYEASLTEGERMALHALLLSCDEPLHELRAKTVPWRDGPDQGMAPSIATLWKIQTRLRTEQMMFGLAGILETVRATKAQLATLTRDTDQEQMLDAAMAAIAREVLDKTLGGQDAVTQKTATRLLLKRADQHRFDRRMTLLEAEFEKNKNTAAAPPKKEENENQG